MRNQGVLLAVGISCLVIAFVFVYVSKFYIPNQDKKMQESYRALYQNKGVFVVVGDDGLQEGTIITEELFNEGTITIQNIPTTFIPKKDNLELVYTTGSEYDPSFLPSAMQTILGKVVKSKIETGSIITYASLGEGEDVAIDSFQKQIQLNVENTVGNNLKTGKYVDIITKYQNGEYDVVVSKVMVDSVITTGIEPENPDNPTPVKDINAKTNGVILVSVDDREYRDIELAERLGQLSIRLYKSVDQYASPVTFNYSSKLSEVNKSITEFELEGAHKAYYEEYPMYMDGKNTISSTSEMYVYLEWYADLYYKLEPFFKDKRIYEKQEDADAYKEFTEPEKLEETITLSELAEYSDLTKLDVLLALIVGNEKIYSASNRLELFTNYIKEDIKTVTGIRKSVASDLVTMVFNYTTKYTGANVDSLAYLIQNGFITKVDDVF